MRELSSPQVSKDTSAAASPEVADAALEPRDLIAAAGFDPDAVRAVVVTAHNAVAIAADYPEPFHKPDDGGI